MVSFPQWWLGDDSTQVTTAIAVGATSGTTYGPVLYHLWNDAGGALGATTLKNCRIRPVVFNGQSRVSSGFPILDEAWVQISVTGMNNVGDSTMQSQTTGFVPIGPNNPLVLGDIPKNCARFINVKIVVPAGAGNLAQELFLELVYDESTVVIPYRMGSMLGPGVIPDWIDPSARRVRYGRAITATGIASVTVAAGSIAYDGFPSWYESQVVALNQNDSVPSALTVGQSYIARLYQSSTTGVPSAAVLVVKGTRSTTPVAPALPAGMIDLGMVTVLYQAGGTSIINTGNVDQSGVLYGEYFVYKGTGLTVKIGAGFAISSIDTQPFSGSTSTIALPDNTAFNLVWLLADGTFTVVSGGSVAAPVIGAQVLANVSTSGGVVTIITDSRTFAARALSEYIIQMPYMGPLTTTIARASWGVLPFASVLESVDIDIGKIGVGASSGNFTVDVLYGVGAGVDIVTDALSSVFGGNPLPTVAYNSTALRTVSNAFSLAQHAYYPAFTRFTFSITTIPAGTFSTEPQDMIVTLHFRKMGLLFG